MTKDSKTQLYTTQTTFLHNKKPADGNNTNFGIFTIKTRNEKPRPGKVHFEINTDRSGSMSEKETDGRTKMECVKQTFTNMLQYLAEQHEKNPAVEFYVSATSFDDHVEIMFEFQKVTKENLSAMLKQVEALYPRGLTDIEAALKAGNELAVKYSSEDMETIQLLMTDGCITAGKSNPDNLHSLLDKNIQNIFIGYGIDHNAALLRKMSETPTGEYYFVDNIENTGMVYGEIVHNIVFRLVQKTHY